MYNHGGLTLISPQYYNFAKNLIQLCDKEMLEGVIYKRKSNSFKDAESNILDSKDLRTTFDNFLNDQGIPTDIKMRIQKLNSSDIDSVNNEILNKTIRSMFNATMKKIKEKKTSYYAKNSC